MSLFHEKSTDSGLDREFLGRGWTFPLDMKGGRVSLSEELEDIHQAILIILQTSPGERVMRPDFGTGLAELVFEPINLTTFEIIRTRVEEALRRWEPRIDVLSVLVTVGEQSRSSPKPRTGLVNIEVNYRVRSTNTEDNLVYPFYLNEVHR